MNLNLCPFYSCLGKGHEDQTLKGLHFATFKILDVSHQ